MPATPQRTSQATYHSLYADDQYPRQYITRTYDRRSHGSAHYSDDSGYLRPVDQRQERVYSEIDDYDDVEVTRM